MNLNCFSTAGIRLITSLVAAIRDPARTLIVKFRAQSCQRGREAHYRFDLLRHEKFWRTKPCFKNA